MVEPSKDIATPVAYISAGCLAVGSFLPWVKLTAPIFGTVTKSGMEGGDGWFTLAAAVLVGALAFFWTGPSARGQATVMLIAAVAIGVAIGYEYSDISSRFAVINSDLISTSFGVGLHLCAVGAAGSVAAACLRLARDSDERVIASFGHSSGHSFDENASL